MLEINQNFFHENSIGIRLTLDKIVESSHRPSEDMQPVGGSRYASFKLRTCPNGQRRVTSEPSTALQRMCEYDWLYVVCNDQSDIVRLPVYAWVAFRLHYLFF